MCISDWSSDVCSSDLAYAEQWDSAGLRQSVRELTGLDLPIEDWAKEEGIAEEEIRSRVNERAARQMAEKAANYGPEVMRLDRQSVGQGKRVSVSADPGGCGITQKKKKTQATKE